MRSFKEKGFSERLQAAAKAKEATLQKFAGRPAEDDPAVVARKAARLDAANAREARAAERAAKKIEEKARVAQLAEEEAARLAAEAELAATREAERKATLEKEQKAARDARYAARKAQK